MIWWLYAVVVLIISWVVGLHLGKFRAAYTEMTGMMLGMTMGMLNGFLLGYAAAGATNSMFWGNLFGILLGLAFGVYYGRAGGLMGALDGGMGGVMGGSMGAMLSVMLFPAQYVAWTAVLLSALYVAGIATLLVLIERSDLRHAALHRTFPWLMRAIAAEADEAARVEDGRGRVHLTDYYMMLGVARDASPEAVGKAYLAKLAHAKEGRAAQLERAFAILSDPGRRAAYDRSLQSANPSPQERIRPRPQRPRPQAARKEPPVSWIGVMALLVAGVVLAAWWFTTSSSAAVPTAIKPTWEPQMGHVEAPAQLDKAQLDAQAVPAEVGTDGVQTVDFKVSGDNMAYKPDVIKVRKGVPARFNISVEGRDPG